MTRNHQTPTTDFVVGTVLALIVAAGIYVEPGLIVPEPLNTLVDAAMNLFEPWAMTQLDDLAGGLVLVAVFAAVGATLSYGSRRLAVALAR